MASIFGGWGQPNRASGYGPYSGADQAAIKASELARFRAEQKEQEPDANLIIDIGATATEYLVEVPNA